MAHYQPIVLYKLMNVHLCVLAGRCVCTCVYLQVGVWVWVGVHVCTCLYLYLEFP